MTISISDPHFEDKTKAIEVLYQVIDPELFVNVIDLGLIYDLNMETEGKIIVTMTLSTPHCPMGEAITMGVENALSAAFPGMETEIILTWEPAWDFTRLTEEGKRQLDIMS